MKARATGEKLAEHKEALDKAAQEERILDFLAYAEGCYGMACAWAEEAEYNMMEANRENDYYSERFLEEK